MHAGRLKWFGLVGLLTLAACPSRPGEVDAGSGVELAGGQDAGPLAACPDGSQLVVETPEAGLARFGTVFSDDLYQVIDLPTAPAGWVDQLNASWLSVRVLSPLGEPVPGCQVGWSMAPGNGWAFPSAPTTDAEGRVRATWTAGNLYDQELTARIETSEGVQTGLIHGRAQPHSTRATSIHLWYDVPERWDQFSVDVTPLTFPTTTYYAAIGFTGGYFGMQNRGPSTAPALADKWILFSVWDTPAGDAQLLSAGPMTCEGFGGEGTGSRCFMTYDWQVGSTYRFEVSYDQPAGSGYTDYTAWFTDVSTQVRQELASLRHFQAVSDFSAYGFVEDWSATGSSCLETEERSAYFHRVRYQAGGAWKDVRGVRFSRVYNEWHDEICANYFAGVENDSFLWSTGGDQRVGQPLLRTQSLPRVLLP